MTGGGENLCCTRAKKVAAHQVLAVSPGCVPRSLKKSTLLVGHNERTNATVLTPLVFSKYLHSPEISKRREEL